MSDTDEVWLVAAAVRALSEAVLAFVSAVLAALWWWEQ